MFRFHYSAPRETLEQQQINKFEQDKRLENLRAESQAHYIHLKQSIAALKSNFFLLQRISFQDLSETYYFLNRFDADITSSKLSSKSLEDFQQFKVQYGIFQEQRNCFDSLGSFLNISLHTAFCTVGLFGLALGLLCICAPNAPLGIVFLGIGILACALYQLKNSIYSIYVEGRFLSGRIEKEIDESIAEVNEILSDQKFMSEIESNNTEHSHP